MQLCMNRMRIGLGLSYAYKSEVINENGQSYMKVPVERNEITGKLRVEGDAPVHTEYSDMLCKRCEVRGVHSDTESFDN